MGARRMGARRGARAGPTARPTTPAPRAASNGHRHNPPPLPPPSAASRRARSNALKVTGVLAAIGVEQEMGGNTAIEEALYAPGHKFGSRKDKQQRAQELMQAGARAWARVVSGRGRRGCVPSSSSPLVPAHDPHHPRPSPHHPPL
jgi:hypothetical protein